MIRSARLVILAFLALAVSGQLVIESAERQIDGSGFVVSVKTTLKLRNDGGAAATGVVLCEPERMFSNRAVMEVTGPKDAKLASKPADPAGKPAGVVCEEWGLPSSLAKGQTLELKTSGSYLHLLTPKPEEITTTEPQRVVFEAPAHLLTPHAVASQKTVFVATSSTILDYGEGSKNGKKVEFGPYADAGPFSTQPSLHVHYENNSPFAQAVSVEREIEVSHWGNVYFEDQYNLRHAGAKVVGEWSRLDYMTKREFGQNAIRELKAVLLPSARSLYYRDEIGNVSTSAARFGKKSVSVQLAPRYPLFGGWTSSFRFGWSLPLEDVVRKVAGRSGKVAVHTTISPALQDLAIDELTIKVVLPEGATDVKARADTDMEQSFEKKYTYLDVLGRTVVVLRRRNVAPVQGSTALTVEYRYSSMGLLQKPLVLVSAFGSLFVVALVLNRSSGKEKDS